MFLFLSLQWNLDNKKTLDTNLWVFRYPNFSHLPNVITSISVRLAYIHKHLLEWRRNNSHPYPATLAYTNTLSEVLTLIKHTQLAYTSHVLIHTFAPLLYLFFGYMLIWHKKILSCVFVCMYVGHSIWNLPMICTSISPIFMKCV